MPFSLFFNKNAIVFHYISFPEFVQRTRQLYPEGRYIQGKTESKKDTFVLLSSNTLTYGVYFLPVYKTYTIGISTIFLENQMFAFSGEGFRATGL